MHEQPARRRAALAGGADGAEQHRGHHEVEIRRLVDDDRVVAAELEEAAAKAGGDSLADAAADLRRAGEADQSNAPVFDEAVRQRIVRRDEQLEDRRKLLRLDDFLADPLHRDRAEGRVVRRLPDADVTADRGDERIPGPDRDREVERGNDADDAERVPLLVHAVPRALGMHRQAVEHARLSDREVGHVDHLLDLAVALDLDLAHLEADQAAEQSFLRAQRLAHEAHGLAAARRRNFAPGGECRGGARHHALVVGLARGAHASDDFARRGVHGVDERRVGGGVPLLAGIRAWIHGLESEAREDAAGLAGDLVLHRLPLGVHRSAPARLRCRPALPSITILPETDLSVPWLYQAPKRFASTSGSRNCSCRTKPR